MLRGSDKFDFVNVYAGGSVNVMFQRKCTAIFICILLSVLLLWLTFTIVSVLLAVIMMCHKIMI